MDYGREDTRTRGSEKPKATHTMSECTDGEGRNVLPLTPRRRCGRSGGGGRRPWCRLSVRRYVALGGEPSPSYHSPAVVRPPDRGPAAAPLPEE